MNSNILKRVLIAWLGLFAIAFANGALRELFIVKLFVEPWAHHLSAASAIMFFGLFVFLIWDFLKIENASVAHSVGRIWLVLTLFTEVVVLNMWLGKMTFNEILQTFNILNGELWPFVLLWIRFCPRLVFSVKGK